MYITYAQAVLEATHKQVVEADNGHGPMPMGVIVHDNHRYYTVRDAPYWKEQAFGFFADEWRAMEEAGVVDIELLYNAKLREGVHKTIYTISMDTAKKVRFPRSFQGGGYFIPMEDLSTVEESWSKE